MNILTTVEQFILNELLSGERQTLDPEEPLFSSGIIDSMGTLRLITFLEEEFGLQIGDGEVGEENFRTLNRIVAFVNQKLTNAGASPA